MPQQRSKGVLAPDCRSSQTNRPTTPGTSLQNQPRCIWHEFASHLWTSKHQKVVLLDERPLASTSRQGLLSGHNDYEERGKVLDPTLLPGSMPRRRHSIRSPRRSLCGRSSGGAPSGRQEIIVMVTAVRVRSGWLRDRSCGTRRRHRGGRTRVKALGAAEATLEVNTVCKATIRVTVRTAPIVPDVRGDRFQLKTAGRACSIGRLATEAALHVDAIRLASQITVFASRVPCPCCSRFNLPPCAVTG